MAKESVFYSFHYDNDVFRVQQIRHMGVVEGDEPVAPNQWEQVKRQGDAAVERWIDENMKYKRCVVVLIGLKTASRPFVKYEIKRAWQLKKGLIGIYIHSLRCPNSGTCSKGSNPFDNWNVDGQSMAKRITCYDPSSSDAYGEIRSSVSTWVSRAIDESKYR